MKIEVLGMGCPKCHALEANVKEALKNLNLEAEVEKVADLSKIMAYGVMTTPALVIDGKVKSAGKLITSDEIAKLLK
jgi:small redox-active disulfide protein 2